MNDRYFFIRANGSSLHNDPSRLECFVPGEPAGQDFVYVDYCLTHGIARIGWPDVGDLRLIDKVPSSTKCRPDIPEHIRQSLNAFRSMTVGDLIVLPDPRFTPRVYIGTVQATYSYSFSPPEHPYECAHRVGVRWDIDIAGKPRPYDGYALGLGPDGIWRRAFATIPERFHTPIDAIRNR